MFSWIKTKNSTTDKEEPKSHSPKKTETPIKDDYSDILLDKIC